jgi:hypothetical protein
MVAVQRLVSSRTNGFCTFSDGRAVVGRMFKENGMSGFRAQPRLFASAEWQLVNVHEASKPRRMRHKAE